MARFLLILASYRLILARSGDNINKDFAEDARAGPLSLLFTAGRRTVFGRAVNSPPLPETLFTAQRIDRIQPCGAACRHIAKQKSDSYGDAEGEQDGAGRWNGGHSHQGSDGSGQNTAQDDSNNTSDRACDGSLYDKFA